MDSPEHAKDFTIKRRVGATVGRPTKFDASVVQALRDALSDGMPIKGACSVAGIAVSTLAEWRERYPELEERMTEAREFARLKALQSIKAAGGRDWRAHAEWLRLSFPADYRPTANQIAVSATASASVTVMTEEQRRAIMERRKAIMAKLDRIECSERQSGK